MASQLAFRAGLSCTRQTVLIWGKAAAIYGTSHPKGLVLLSGRCHNTPHKRWHHCKTEKTWASWEALKEKENIVLMGLPGSGKTTTGRLLGEKLSKRVFDVDDDLLTPLWGMSVAEKHRQIGGRRFLEEEGKALLSLDVSDAIVSLSGSNPLHPDSMAAATSTGLVIYLDAATETILGRQQSMKVDRIIGMEDGATLEEVINSRREVYEKWHDVRVFVHAHDSPSDVSARVMNAVARFTSDPGHVSTRDVTRPGKSYTFLQAVLQGLAPDGGLFVKPSHWPRFSLSDLDRLVHLDVRERALRLLEAWIHPLDLSPQMLRQFVEKSYTRGLFDHPHMCPTVSLGRNIYTQELFHGPTASFKDWALQLMPRFFAHAANQLAPDKRFIILAATSGDTGSATLDGFGRHVGKARIGALVLYPSHNISEIQKQQTVTMEGNSVKVIGVDGDFDFCQQTVKRIFNDSNSQKVLGDCHLSAANSMNWGRLLPQVLFHVTAYLDLVKQGHVTLGDPVDFCIPTGNFGNILSAYYAKEMGVPIRRLVCASNTNNILTEFLTTGVYSPAKYKLKKTVSPSIDIIASSNLERMLYHVTKDPAVVAQFYCDVAERGEAKVSDAVVRDLQRTFVAGYATEEDTLQTIRDVYQEMDYILDPHTAVGYHVAKTMGDPEVPTVLAGTAHFAKFLEDVLPALGLSDSAAGGQSLTTGQLLTTASAQTARPGMHTLLGSVASKPVLHTDTVSADYDQIWGKLGDLANSL